MLAPSHVRPEPFSECISLWLDDLQGEGREYLADSLSSRDTYLEEETEPIGFHCSGPSTPPATPHVRGGSRHYRDSSFSNSPTCNSRFAFTMEKVKDTMIARFVDKLAVPSEPGLTNAQLMLTNHDLKPGQCCYLPKDGIQSRS